MNCRGWYGQRVAAVCVVLAAVAGAGYLLKDAEIGPRESWTRAAFTVTIRHFGVDAREIERSIAVPLENALASAPGSSGVSSTSEYGKARVVVRFAFDTDKDRAYEAVRDAAERVYQTLPSSVQRPELGTTSEGRGPVWIASVYSEQLTALELGRMLERSVKPALETLSGAGEVEIGGTGRPEITVEVDEAAASVLGVDARAVAESLALSDVLIPAGVLRSDGRQLAIVADGRTVDALMLLDESVVSASGKPVPLGAFCRIHEGSGIPESLSRVDGKPAMTVAVHSGGGANLLALSRALSGESEALARACGIRFEVLLDAGADVSRSFDSTISAALQGALAVALATALLAGPGGAQRKKRRSRLVAVIAVPLMLLFSSALLSALGLGFDRHVLSGLAIGLGSAIDSAILASERLGKVTTVERGAMAMRGLAPSLASGAATTLVVLVPLAGLDFISEGVDRIAAAIGTVCIVSFLFTVLVMPPLMLGGCEESVRKDPPKSLGRKSRARRFHRLLARNAVLCGSKPLLPLAAAASLSLAGIVAVLAMPLEPRELEDDNAVYAQVEFEPGIAATGVDLRLADYSQAAAGIKGLKRIQSTARLGSGSVYVSFDPAMTDREKVAESLRKISVSGGFLWIPASSTGSRLWELVVSGDDDLECQRLCVLAARAVSSLPFISETVLNFKDGPPDLVLTPDRDRAASLGAGFESAAAALRSSIHGPVAYKRLGRNGETDVRVTIMRSGRPEASDAGSTLVLSGGGGIRVDSITESRRIRDVSRINRRDGQRVASITMRSGPLDPREARDAVRTAVSHIELPPGYRLEFDREAIEAANRLESAGWSFLLAAAFAYMVTAAVTESYGAPLSVLSALPPSLAVPALLLFASGTPMDATVACAFVAVSGMVVNASVLTVDERRSQRGDGYASVADLYRLMRARFGSLAATTGTTVAGALPFLFLRDAGSAMVRSLAFVAATGTAASFIMALTVIPALASVAPALFRGFSLSENQVKEE